MEHICKLLSEYDKIYKKREYGIECEEIEIKLKERALFYVKSKVSACPDIDCLACGINQNLSYKCNYLTTTSIATNNLIVQLKDLGFCYNLLGNTYTFKFNLGISFNDPNTAIFSIFNSAIYGTLTSVVPIGTKLENLGDGAYSYEIEIPSDPLNGTSITIDFSISDGTTVIPFTQTMSIDKTCNI